METATQTQNRMTGHRAQLNVDRDTQPMKRHSVYIIGFAIIVLVSLLLITVFVYCNTKKFRAKHPPIMLWAWQRPEDLLALNPKTTGVAFWSQTIYLDKNDYSVLPRQQTLLVPPHTYMEPVVRLEIKPHAQTNAEFYMPKDESKSLVETIIAPALRFKAKSLQIDFDARTSERHFYKMLLSKIHQALPKDVNLSMTALASWCLADNWLNNLPVDEIVPMLFTMGQKRKTTVQYINERHNNLSLLKKCIGISLAEPDILQTLKNNFTELPQSLYVFSPIPWETNSIHQTESELMKLWR